MRQRGPWLGVLIGDVLGSRAPAQANHTREATISEMIAHLGINRFGQPEEIGNLVAFLCSPKADFIAGTVIDMDGGETRALRRVYAAPFR